MAVPIAELFVSIGADITGLQAGLNQAQKQIQSFQKTIASSAGTQNINVVGNTAGATDAAKKTASAFDQITNAGKKVTNVGNSIQGVGRDLSIGLTAPIVAAGAAIFHAGAGFEHQLTEVRKSTGLTGDDLAQFGQQLVAFSQTPDAGGTTADNLAKIAAIGGQLGITGDELIGFTKTAAKLSVSTGIAPEQIAEDLGRIKAVAHLTIPQLEQYGSTITALGNDMGGTESDILEFSRRLGGPLSALGVSVQNVSGISSALAEVGVNPEAGATAVQKFFIDMTKAASGAGSVTDEQAKKMQNLQDRISDLNSSLAAATLRQQQFGRNSDPASIKANADAIEKYKRELGQAQSELGKLQSTAEGGGIEKFAQVAGVSVDEFKALVAGDPTAAFQKVIEGIGRIQREQGKGPAVNALADLGIDDSRQVQAFLTLAQGSGSLAKGLDIANKSFEENTALNDEVRAKMEDTINQMELLKAKINAVIIEGWEPFKGAVKEVIALLEATLLPKLTELKDAFVALTPEQQRNVLLFAGLAAVLGPALVLLGILVTVLGALLTPIGLVILGIIALAALWATNTGDIQGKTAAVVGFIAGAFDFITNTVFPAVGQAIQNFLGLFSGIADIIKREVGLIGSIIGLLITIFQKEFNFISGLISGLISGEVNFMVGIFQKGLALIGSFFDQFLKAPLQAIGGWIAQFVFQPLLALLTFLGQLAAKLGLTSLAGFDVGGAITAAQGAIDSLNGQIGGGGGAAAGANVQVNINNPNIPDAATGDMVVQQALAAFTQVMVDSQNATPLPQPAAGALPGQPF